MTGDANTFLYQTLIIPAFRSCRNREDLLEKFAKLFLRMINHTTLFYMQKIYRMS